MTNEEKAMVERIEQAIEDRDPRSMRDAIAEWDGKPAMSGKQYRETFQGARRREWIDYLIEECEELIDMIKTNDADDYWATRGHI
jgi:hypothetical protein